MISERPIKVLDDDRATRQELDLDFLHSGYRRKLYVVSEPGLGCRRRARRSNTPLLLVPIPIGSDRFGRLLSVDGDGRVMSQDLRGGRYYYVPPGVPHEIRADGVGALEVFAPKTSPVLWFDDEPLPDDYFDRLLGTAAEDQGRGSKPLSTGGMKS